MSESYLLKLHPSVIGVDAHWNVNQFLIDKQLQVFELALLGVSLKAALGKDCLEGSTLESMVLVADDNDVVAASCDGLSANIGTPFIGEI